MDHLALPDVSMITLQFWRSWEFNSYLLAHFNQNYRVKKKDLQDWWRKDTRKRVIVLLHPIINRRAALLYHTKCFAGITSCIWYSSCTGRCLGKSAKPRQIQGSFFYYPHQVINSLSIFWAESLFRPLYLILPTVDWKIFFHIPWYWWQTFTPLQ